MKIAGILQVALALGSCAAMLIFGRGGGRGRPEMAMPAHPGRCVGADV